MLIDASIVGAAAVTLATSYAFGDVFGLDLHEIEAELTLAGVNPAMEGLRGLAEQSLRAAHELAEQRGRTVAAALPGPVVRGRGDLVRRLAGGIALFFLAFHINIAD